MPLLDVFKKKKPEPAAPMPPPGAPLGAPPAGLPVDQVISMKQQGFSNQQISAALQQQGFTTQQIYDATSQAEIRPKEEPFAGPAPIGPPPGLPPRAPPGMLPTGPPQAPPEKRAPEGFEEMAESIIEEKWHEVTREMDKVNEWKELTSSRVDKMEQNMADIKADLDNLHKAIVSKIGDYDKNLLDVGTEIKAMEKVFQKVLPELTDNVAALSKMAGRTKRFVPEKPEKKTK